jgi:hypothetical protein
MPPVPSRGSGLGTGGIRTRTTPCIAWRELPAPLRRVVPMRPAGGKLAFVGRSFANCGPERDLCHSVNTRGRISAALRLALCSEEVMDLSTKLKITAALATMLMAVVWAVPVPV